MSAICEANAKGQSEEGKHLNATHWVDQNITIFTQKIEFKKSFNSMFCCLESYI